jgi:hypothetical protein
MTKEPSMRVTGNRLWLAAGLVAVSVWPGAAFAASTITGTFGLSLERFQDCSKRGASSRRKSRQNNATPYPK